MKLNKREQQAFDTLRDILDFYEKDEESDELTLGYGYWNSVREVFGIDLKECTFYKKEVEKFVRGKEKKHLCYVPMDWKAPAYPYGYFPFQVKTGKKNRDRNEKNVREYVVLDIIDDEVITLKNLIKKLQTKAETRINRETPFRQQEVFKKYKDLLTKMEEELQEYRDELSQAMEEEKNLFF